MEFGVLLIDVLHKLEERTVPVTVRKAIIGLGDNDVQGLGFRASGF